jgi:hypothetical protein
MEALDVDIVLVANVNGNVVAQAGLLLRNYNALMDTSHDIF